MKNIQQNGNNIHKKEIEKLTRKIKKSSPAETLNLISDLAATIENNHVKEWLSRFTKTFQFLHNGGKQ